MELIGNKVRGHGDIAHLIHRPAFIRPAELNNLLNNMIENFSEDSIVTFL